MLCRFYLWSNQVIIMLISTCALRHVRTKHIYWWLSDYYFIKKEKKKKHIRPLGNLAHHHVGANCRFAAELLNDWNDCANGERLTLRSFKREKLRKWWEADVAFVQTWKTQSLYNFSTNEICSLSLLSMEDSSRKNLCIAFITAVQTSKHAYVEGRLKFLKTRQNNQTILRVCLDGTQII